MLVKSIGVAGLTLSSWALLAVAQQSAPAPAPQLQARLERIESIRAIKRLQYAYGHYTELGLWNDFADLFTADAVTNYQQGAHGKEEVRKLFFDQVGQGKLGLADGRIYPHILFQPVITLAPDGRTAKGRWRILAMLGGYGGGATWYSGVYENEYVREGGVWKISVLRSEPKATAAYTAAGWKDSGVRLPTHYGTAAVTASAPTSVAGSSTNSQLAQRAARLVDQAQVTNILNTYGNAFNSGLWGTAADLFAKDGTLELGLQGVYVGNASIRRALQQFQTEALRDHFYLQTVVTVAPDGQTANARGVELIFSSANGGELGEGTFENSFVKQNGTWKIRSVHYYPRMIVDAAAGWAKSAKPAPGVSKQVPPNRPPTATYEIYPKFSVAPFHFDNPVTGEAPQYPAGVPTRSRIAAVPPNGVSTANTAQIERSIAEAEAYEAAENLVNAYGYSQDDRGSVFVDQILQPVIDVSPNGTQATIRARTLDLGGTSGGPGTWTAGTLEAQASTMQGSWDLPRARTTVNWSASYPGGWGKK